MDLVANEPIDSLPAGTAQAQHQFLYQISTSTTPALLQTHSRNIVTTPYQCGTTIPPSQTDLVQRHSSVILLLSIQETTRYTQISLPALLLVHTLVTDQYICLRVLTNFRIQPSSNRLASPTTPPIQATKSIFRRSELLCINCSNISSNLSILIAQCPTLLWFITLTQFRQWTTSLTYRTPWVTSTSTPAHI